MLIEVERKSNPGVIMTTNKFYIQESISERYFIPNMSHQSEKNKIVSI